MENTLHDKDNLILDKISYHLSSPERYDIVVFPVEINDSGDTEYYIKRVIGLPGEKVEIKNGFVFINGKKLEDDIYAKGNLNKRAKVLKGM